MALNCNVDKNAQWLWSAKGPSSSADLAAEEPPPEPALGVCKYGENCNRPNCPLEHLAKKDVLCKFGAKCNRPACPFKHEPSAAAAAAAASPQGSPALSGQAPGR